MDGPALVGREDALGVLAAEVERVLADEFRVVLVTGAPGLGKTRLVAEALDRHAGEAASFSARSYRWGSTTSFGPWVEALDRGLRGRTEEELRAVCGSSVRELSLLLTSVATIAEPPDPPPRRERLLMALVDLFDGLTAARPVLVALDDVHLADTSSWEALRYLGRRLSDAPLGVFVTARPADLRKLPIAEEVIVGLEEEGLLTRLALEPLTRAQVTELAHTVLRAEAGGRSSFVPEPLVAWLMERSVGHPLFVIGLVRALLEEGADLLAPRLERLPAGLRDRVALDLRALTAEQRQVLEILAVTDRRLDLGDLQRLAEIPPDPLAQVLEALCAARLVSEQRDGAALAYEVVHPIVQDAVYEGIGGARRRALHRAIGRTLLASDRLGAAAGHFAQAAEPGDDEAVVALCRAMALAEARGLYQEALATLAALVDVLPAGDARWTQVLEAMDRQAEWVLSHLAENDADTAVTAMQRIEGVLEGSDDLAARATVRSHLAAFLSFGVGRLEEADDACQRAIELFAAAGEDEAELLARNELGWIRGCAGRFDEQVRLASEALEAALERGHRRAAVQAAGTAAYALGMLGRWDEADAMYARSIELAGEEGNTYRIAWAHAQRGCALSMRGLLGEATASVEAALEEDPGAPDALAYEDLAHCHWLAGRFEEALEALERSAVRRPIRGSRRRAWGAALAARVHLEMGHRGRAETGLAQASATYGGEPFLAWGFWEPWTSAWLAWHADGPAGAAERLAEVAEDLASVRMAPYEGLVLVDLAEAAAEAGDAGRCAAAAGRLEVVAAELGGLHPALAALATAWSHLTGQRLESAATSAEDAADALTAAGYRVHAGSALHVLGRARERLDRPAGISALQQAAELFDLCGAVWRRDRVLGDLARLGSRGRRAAAAVQGPAALTGREREVAQLAVQGFTAREIGAQLFIGRRTVETHLAACYAKLGVRSKGELIRRAAELDLTTSTSAP